MKNIFLSLIFTFTTFFSAAYANPKTLCSVNNSRPAELSCAGGWVEVPAFPEVLIKMKRCFGYKSTERLTVEIDGSVKIYNSVIFPFSVRQSGYSIKCSRSDQGASSDLNVF